MSSQRICLVVSLALAIGGSAAVLIVTAPHGPGISPDSVCYIVGSKSLLAGNGYLNEAMQPSTYFPPLFPSLLALLGLAGIEPATAARYLNALAFGGTIFLSANFLRGLWGPGISVLGAMVMLVSVPLPGVSRMVWTEPLFIVFELAFLFFLASYSTSQKLRFLVLSGIAVALACLTRYVGVTLILTGILVLLCSSSPVVRKAKAVAYFAVLSTLPLALWLFRNWLCAHTLTGERPSGATTLIENIRQAGTTLAKWSLPWRIVLALPGTVFLAALFALLVIAFAVLTVKCRGTRQYLSVLPISVLAPVYVTFLIASSSASAMDPIASRLLSPLFPPLALLALSLVAVAFRAEGEETKTSAKGLPAKALRALIVICVATWLCMSSARLADNVQSWFQRDDWGYNSAKWQRSETMTYLNHRAMPALVLSNEPSAVSYLTNHPCSWWPVRTSYRSLKNVEKEQLAMFQGQLGCAKIAWLVWFRGDDAASGTDMDSRDKATTTFISIEQLAGASDIVPMVTLSDGVVYLVKAKQEGEKPDSP